MKNSSFPDLPSIAPLPGVSSFGHSSFPSLQSIQALESGFKKPWRRQLQQQLLSDYNDPYALNSFADVILTTFNRNMKRGNWAGLENIPLLNILTGTLDVLNETTLKPLKQGRLDIVGLNALINLGETMDIPANLVKGLLFEGGQGFLNALGYGGQGRHNYDIETGNFVIDIVGEILIDPMNWITLFGKSAITATTKTATAAAIKEAAGEAGEKLAKEIGQEASEKLYKRLASRATRAFLEGDFKTMDDAIRAVADNMAKNGLFKINKNILTEDIASALRRAVTIAEDTATMRALNGLQKIVAPAEAYEKLMMKGAMTASGIYPTWASIQLGKTFVSNFTTQRSLAPLKPFLKFDHTLSIMDYAEAKKVFDEGLDNLDIALKTAKEKGLSPETFTVLMQQSVRADMHYIDRLFREYADKLDELLVELIAFLKEKHGINVLDDLLKQVNLVNEFTDDAYGFYARYLEDRIKDVRRAQDYLAATRQVKDMEIQGDIIHELELRVGPQTVTQFKQHMQATFQKATQTFIDLKAAQEADWDLREFIFHELNEFKQTKIVDFFAWLKENEVLYDAKRLPVSTEAIDNIERIYTQFFNEVERQLHWAIRNVERTYDTSYLKLNYAKTNPINRLNYYLKSAADKYQQLKTPLIEELKNDKIFKTIADRLERNVAVESSLFADLPLIKTLRKEKARYLGGGELGQTVKKVRERLQEVFNIKTTSDDPLQFEEWWAQRIPRQTDVGISPHRFSEAMTRLLTSDPMKAQIFAEDWLEAQFVVSRMSVHVPELREIDNMLQAVDPYRRSFDLLKVQAEGVLYQFKLEHVHTNLALMNLPQFNDLMAQIHVNTHIGKWVHEMSKVAGPGSEACKALLNLAERYNAYLIFLERVMYAPMDEGTRIAFLSTIQKYARANPEKIMGNFDWQFDKIVEEMEAYINSVAMPRSLSLEKLVDSLKLDIPKDVAHTSLWDVETLIQVIQKELPEHFQDSTKLYLISDIETLGQVEAIHSVLDITTRELNSPMDASQTIMRKLDPKNPTHIPQDRLLRVFNTDINGFFERYKDGVTEKELLQAFVDNIKAQAAATGKTPVLVFHNGDEFDLGFIKARMQAQGLSRRDIRFFEQIETIDTLKLLREKDNYKTIADRAKRTLRELLSTYGEQVLEMDVNKFIDPNNGELASVLKELSDVLRETASKGSTRDIELFQFAEHMRRASEEAWTQLRNIKNSNEQMKWQYLSSEWINSADGQSWFLEHMYQIRKRTAERMALAQRAIRGEVPALLGEPNLDWMQYAPTREELAKELGEYLNISKLMYSAADGAHYLGFKRAVDWELIQEYFKVGDLEEIHPAVAERLTRLGRIFDKLHASIKNPGKLIPFAEDIRQTLELLVPQSFATTRDAKKLQELLKTITMTPNRVSGFFAYMRTDKQDLFSNWVMLQFIYDQYVKKDLLTDTLKAKINPDLLKLLDKRNRASVYLSLLPGTDRNYLEHFSALEIDEYVASPKTRRAVAKEFQQLKDNLTALARVYDDNHFARASTQAFSAALEDVQGLLDTFTAQMDNMAVHEQIRFVEQLRAYTDQLAEQQLAQMLTLDAKTLRDFMAYNAPWFEFDVRELTRQPHTKQLFLDFLQRQAEFEAQGLVLFNAGERFYVGLSKDLRLEAYVEQGRTQVTLNTHKITRPILNELDTELAGQTLDNVLRDKLNTARRAIHRLSENQISGSLGEVVSTGYYEALYKDLPEEFKNQILPFEVMTQRDLFRGPRYNFTNLGSVNARKARDEFMPSTVISLYKRSAEQSAALAHKRVLYTQLYYDNSFSINVGWMKDATNEEILEQLRANPHFVLTALVEDAQVGYRAVQIPATNVKMIEEARRLNAVVMPEHTFSKVYETVNLSQFNEAALNIWQKIIYAYKVGFLLDPGVWFRNWIDSTLKTIVSSGGDAKEAAEKKIMAMDLLYKYDQINDAIIKLDEAYGGRFTRENLDNYFNGLTGEPLMPRETWEFIHGYIMDGPSAGLTQRWEKYYQVTRDPDEMMNFYQAFVHYSRKLMHPNSWIEQVERLTYYIMLTERGLTTTEAFHQLSKAHFDYAMKSPFERAMELVFPFYTFTMRNLEYWVDAVSNKPWVARMFRDVMIPTSGIPQITPEELERNRSLQFQILSGNIPLTDFTNTPMTLKTSPSYMDAFNVLTNPIGAFKQRLAPPFQIAVDGVLAHQAQTWDQAAKNALAINSGGGMLEQSSEILPVFGAMYQRYGESGPKHAERTGSVLPRILPGIFGSTLRYGPQRRTSYQPKQYIRRVYPRKIYAPRPFVAWRQRPYARRHYYQRPPRWVPADSFYKKHYTPTGVSRMKMRMVPVTSATLKYRLKEMWGHIR